MHDDFLRGSAAHDFFQRGLFGRAEGLRRGDRYLADVVGSDPTVIAASRRLSVLESSRQFLAAHDRPVAIGPTPLFELSASAPLAGLA